MKSNRHPPLLRALRRLDACGFDTCSPAEVARARAVSRRKTSRSPASRKSKVYRILRALPPDKPARRGRQVKRFHIFLLVSRSSTDNHDRFSHL
jgi:hypothetical protein